MKKKICLWCLRVKAEEESWYYEFDKDSDFHFCSEKCLKAATFMRGGERHLDMGKIKQHTGRLAREGRRIRKSELMAVFMAKKKFETEDVAVLFGLLTPAQKKVAALVGLAHLSRAAEGDPERLMNSINDKVRILRG